MDLGTCWLGYRIHISQLADGSSSLLPATKRSACGRIAFFMLMFTVYVLYSSRYNKIYVGYTSNLAQRILSHNIHTEVFEEKTAAMKREKELKSARGRAWIWELVG